MRNRRHYSFKDLDLYHKDVFMPVELLLSAVGPAFARFENPQPRYLRLSYSVGAKRRVETDGVPFQDYVTLRPDNIVEIGCVPSDDHGFNEAIIDTIVVREPFSATKDILLSIAVDFQLGVGFVKLAWTHTPGLPHFSVRDRRCYVQAPKPAFNPVFNSVTTQLLEAAL